MVETIDNTAAARIAHQKFSITKPAPRIHEAIDKTIALTTKVNSPNVKKLRGAVRNSRTGRIKVLINPIIIAASTAVLKSAIEMPLSSQSVISRAKALAKMDTISLMI